MEEIPGSMQTVSKNMNKSLFLEREKKFVKAFKRKEKTIRLMKAVT